MSDDTPYRHTPRVLAALESRRAATRHSADCVARLNKAQMECEAAFDALRSARREADAAIDEALGELDA